MKQKLMMKLALTFLAAVLFLPCFAANKPVDAIAVIVNDSIITLQEIQLKQHWLQMQIKLTQNKDIPLAKLEKDARSLLVVRALQLQKAKTLKIKIQEDWVKSYSQQYYQQYQLSKQAFADKLAAYHLDQDYFEQEIKDTILMQQVQQRELGPKIEVSANEVAHFLHDWQLDHQRIHLKHYFVPITEGVVDKVLAAKIADDIVQGKIAKNRTNITVENIEGKAYRDLPDVFVENILKHNKSKGFIPPILTGNGYHVLEIIAIQHGKAITSAQARNILLQQKLQGETQAWLESLKKEAWIKVLR
jgi:hypothetical protein